jgi:hypothetical protein
VLAAISAKLDGPGTYLTSSLTAAMSLCDGLDTPARSWRMSLRVSMSY